jgi:hypothetical protein
MGTTQDDHTQMFAYGSSIFVKEEPEPEREAAWWRPAKSKYILDRAAARFLR